jgi:membrane protein
LAHIHRLRLMIIPNTQRLKNRLWHQPPRNRLEGAALTVARHVVVIGRDFADGQISLRAMSLVYTSLLSLVPMLALAFSLFKALGVHNALEPALLGFLEPLGPRAEEITSGVIGFVENIQVGVLGSLGIGLLLYAAVSLIQKVESSFNWIWRIERQRSIGARFGEYLSVLIVGPFAVFLSLGITATALNSTAVQAISQVEPFGILVQYFTKLIPYLLIIGVFSFLYAFIPNTRVKMSAALGGGLLAGVLWQSASLAFASFVAHATNYNAIYSGFAIVIFLLIWLYVGWLILLLGCQLSFYLQHREFVTPEKNSPMLSARAAERLGLAIFSRVGHRFLNSEPALIRDDLAKALPAPPEHVDRVIDVLIHQRILIETNETPPRLVPQRDLDGLSLSDLWCALRQGLDRDGPPTYRRDVWSQAIDTVAMAESGFDNSNGGVSVRQWLQSKDKPAT